jgi:biotin-(acetyl-CoA carboxylase) ligase
VEGSRLGVLVGIGLNCNQVEFPEDLEPKAVSLAGILGREVSLPSLLEEILSRLKTSLVDQQWHAKVSARLYGLNRVAYLWVPSESGGSSEGQGSTSVRGWIRGLARDGALLFQPEDRTPPIAVYGGEIRFAGGEDC